MSQRRMQKKNQENAAQDEQQKNGEHKRRIPRYNSLDLYIYKVLKHVHPELGLSKTAMRIVHSFAMDCFDRVASEAGRLLQTNKKATLDTRAVQTAVKLILPAELAKQANNEIKSCLTKYLASMEDNSRSKQ